jgi:PAS domain S-box-containing protein
MSADNWSRIKVLSEVRRYGLAISACALALVIGLPIDAPSSCFFLAVTASGLFGGKGPGILSVVLSALAFDYYFLPPQRQLTIEPLAYPRFAAFLGAAVLILVLVGMKRRSDESRLQIHARYQAIADAAPDAIVSIDENNRIELVNLAATKIFGWAEADLIGQPLTLLLPNFRVAEGTTDAEWTGRRRDGRDFSAEVSFRELSSGGRKSFTGFVRDVTDRKRADAALRKSESYLAQAQALSKTGSFGLNPSTGELFWSQETFQLVGLDPSLKPSLELVIERIHPHDRERTQDQIERALESGADLDLEHRFRMPDGSVKHVRVLARATKGEAGELQYIGAAMDITAQVRAEETLRASERDLRLIVDSIPGLVSTMAPSGDAELVNERVMSYTGKSMEEMKDWLPTIHPEDRASVADWWRRSVETGSPYDVEERIQRADGVYRWFHARGLPLRDAEGHIVRWYILLTDIDDRVRAEQALRASELDLRLIVDSIPGLVCTLDASGEIESVNRQIRDYTGRILERVQDWQAIVHPDDFAPAMKQWAHSIETGEPLDTELRVRRTDGVFRWFHVRSLPLWDPGGSILRWYTLLTDIEDRKQAEESVRLGEYNFRMIVDSIPGLVHTLTPAGEIEHVSQQLLDLSGRTLEELKYWPQFVHPDDRARVNGLVRRAIESGEPYDAEIRIVPADGGYRWFHSRGVPLRDGEGSVVRWYCLLTDVEDRKVAEEALRASERELSLIIETIPALVWCAAPNGELTYVNRRVLDYTGSTLAAMAKAGWIDYLHPDDVEPTVDAWTHALTSDRQYEVQYRLRRFDGTYRWFHVLGQIGRDSDGHMTRWYGLLIDIDERKKTEEALRSTQARLSRASQIATVGELAASIAHEVNQPLSAVVANGHACLRWLLAQPPNLGKAHEAAERIVRDGKDAGEVVRRIRALFKRAAIERTPLDVNDVIREVLSLLRSETDRKGVAVETSLEEDLPTVVADRVQLQQVLLNLLSNGLDAMDSVVGRPKKLAVRSKTLCPDAVLIEVRDFGVGLTNADQVFEAFFTTKEHGMGMGLAICRSIVEAHEGRIWASSEEAPGTTFSFTLPVKAGS